MWIADLESVWMSNGAVGGVIATATAVAIASILVELVGSSLTRPRKSAGASGPWVNNHNHLVSSRDLIGESFLDLI
jgi:hypothetical protein